MNDKKLKVGDSFHYIKPDTDTKAGTKYEVITKTVRDEGTGPLMLYARAADGTTSLFHIDLEGTFIIQADPPKIPPPNAPQSYSIERAPLYGVRQLNQQLH